MHSTAFRMLYDNIHDFKNTAVHIEQLVSDYGLNPLSDDVVPDMNGRTHVEMWGYMKVVSHFNLAIALELMLKLLLHLDKNDLSKFKHHCLTKLHDALPGTQQLKLETLYQQSRNDVLPHGHKVHAYRAKDTRKRAAQENERFPKRDPDLWKFRNALKYFDSDAMMALKRYTWEHVNKGKWHHYIRDVSAFVELIDRVMADIERR